MSRVGYEVNRVVMERVTITIEVAGEAPRVYTFHGFGDYRTDDVVQVSAHMEWENRLRLCVGTVYGACDSLVSEIAHSVLVEDATPGDDAPTANAPASRQRTPEAPAPATHTATETSTEEKSQAQK